MNKINIKLLTVITILFLVLAIIGCSQKQADLEGIILDINNNMILLAKDLSVKDYNKIKDQSPLKLREQDVLGEIESLNLYELTYNKSGGFSKGDDVKVWLDGPILSSYPALGKVKKIELKD